ncbi:MAG: hypothetical protein VB050_12175 [Geobacteraceae bacterium]|nr:hypothetical protein [Geobacteraceae bacterium]
MKTAENLKKYAQELERVCPEPGKWHQLWEMLPNREQKSSGGWNPPLPLILAAWPHTSALQKRLRLLEHIDYAESHGVIEEISNFLKGLPESQWVHFGEL